jgi:hypothetical protein
VPLRRLLGRGAGGRLAVLALVLLVALPASGCGVEIVGPPAVRTSPSEAGAEEPASTADSGDEAQATAAEESPDPLADARRSSYDGRVDVTLDCAGGEVTLDQSDQITRITQDCNTVTVNGDYTKVVAERIGTLHINSEATFATVVMTSATQVTIDADFAHVYWDEGNPGVKAAGFKSTANPNPVKER